MILTPVRLLRRDRVNVLSSIRQKNQQQRPHIVKFSQLSGFKTSPKRPIGGLGSYNILDIRHTVFP